jgi:nucleoside-triphosphatase THEP1
MIYILTGDIRTGKTTALLNWASTRKDVDGILCPDNENGKRYFLKVKPGEEFELEVEIESEKTITIGPFHFLKSAFGQANDYLIETNKGRDFKYLIVDELGKLELKNEGLHHATKALIPDFMFKNNKYLIFVVRASLLEDVINHYQIESYTLLTKEDLKTIV